MDNLIITPLWILCLSFLFASCNSINPHESKSLPKLNDNLFLSEVKYSSSLHTLKLDLINQDVLSKGITSMEDFLFLSIMNINRFGSIYHFVILKNPSAANVKHISNLCDDENKLSGNGDIILCFGLPDKEYDSIKRTVDINYNKSSYIFSNKTTNLMSFQGRFFPAVDRAYLFITNQNLSSNGELIVKTFSFGHSYEYDSKLFYENPSNSNHIQLATSFVYIFDIINKSTIISDDIQDTKKIIMELCDKVPVNNIPRK